MPDLTPETIAELERLRIGRAKHLAKTTLRDPSSIHGRGSVLEQDLARCILALLAERERLRAERDELLQRCGQAIAFVQTGGPLFTKDRLELLAILYHAAADGAEGAPDA